MAIVEICANDSSAEAKKQAEVKCTSENDFRDIYDVVSQKNQEVHFFAGKYTLDKGSKSPAGNRYLDIGAGTKVIGEPGVQFFAPNSMVRITTKADNVTLKGFEAIGFIMIQNWASNITREDITLRATLDGKSYAPLWKQGGATALFMDWGRRGYTMQNIVNRRCIADHSPHHGFSMNIGVAEGGGFADILYDSCAAMHSGAGFNKPRAWATGFDVPDAGDIRRMRVIDCAAIDSYQSGFHMDGYWTGHAQAQEDVKFIRCYAALNGWRSNGNLEMYQCGFYLQDAWTENCWSFKNKKAGFLFKNERGGVHVVNCIDQDSAYGLVLESNSPNAVVENFISVGATRRAFQCATSNAKVDVQVYDFKGQGSPVLTGIHERIEYVDCPNHLSQVESKYRAMARPTTGTFKFTSDQYDTIASFVAIHPVSKSSVNLSKVTITKVAKPELIDLSIDPRNNAPVEDEIVVPPVVLPPDPVGVFVYEPDRFHAIRLVVPLAGRDVPVAEMQEDLKQYYKPGTYVLKEE